MIKYLPGLIYDRKIVDVLNNLVRNTLIELCTFNINTKYLCVLTDSLISNDQKTLWLWISKLCTQWLCHEKVNFRSSCLSRVGRIEDSPIELSYKHVRRVCVICWVFFSWEVIRIFSCSMVNNMSNQLIKIVTCLRRTYDVTEIHDI